MRPAGIAFLTLLLVGCSSFSESLGDRMLAPVLAEIARFQSESGRLPNSLTELPAHGRLKLEEQSQDGIVWSITLLRPSAQSYWLEFNHVHGVVRYVDGKKVYASGNMWR